MVTNQQTALPQQQRAGILDALRGFALLGICIANYPFFSMYVFVSDEGQAALPTATVDAGLNFFETAFVEGKFYSLFSLLFGIGFTVIFLNNKARGVNGLGVFYRRLFMLMLIGLAHALLIWNGDILLLYALLGMLLPLFRNCSDRTLLVTAVFLIFSPLLFDAAKVLSNGKWDLSTPLAARAIADGEARGITENNFRTWLLTQENYNGVLQWNLNGFYWRWEMLLGTNRLPKVFAMFLIGLWAGRKMLYAKLEENKSLLKKVQSRGLIIGLPATIAFTFFGEDGRHLPSASGLLDTLFYALSVIPLSLFYTTSFCLLWLNEGWKKKLGMLVPAGRMALTNYVTQSLLGIIIFYGVGMGLGTKLGPSVFMPIAIGVFCLQVIWSTVWLRYFNYGPLEWLWRMATYGKWLGLKKQKQERV